MMRKGKIIAGLTAAAGMAGAAACGISWNIVSSAMGGKRQTYEEAYAWQKKHYDTGFFDELEKKEYTVKGAGGYELHVLFCANPGPSSKYMILTHGYTDNRYGSLKYMQIYLHAGFHCIIWDLRGHGAGEQVWCTYGIEESKDLLAVIDDAHKRFPDMTVLGLHGESLGSATTVTALKAQPDVDFVVADCGFADIENVLKGIARSTHLPAWAVDLSSVLAKHKRGYSFKDMRPIDALTQNTIPILFIHGKDDTFITPDNSERMYEMTKGKKALRLIEGAGHAKCRLAEPELYAQYVTEWIEELGLE